MRKNCIRKGTLRIAKAVSILFLLSLILGYILTKLDIASPSSDSPFFTYLYAVTGILFSLGVSMIISFEYSDIHDNSYYSKLSADLTHIVHLLTATFFTSTTLLLLGVFGALDGNNRYLKLLTFTPLTFQIVSIAWMSLIFLRLFKLKKDLTDHRRKK